MILGMALAGGVGAVCRYLADAALRRWVRVGFPVGTLVVNVLGSFVLGLTVGLQRADVLAPMWVFVVGAGFCGGFTTFSTASLEVCVLAHERRWLAAAAHVAAMVGICLAAAWLGFCLGN